MDSNSIFCSTIPNFVSNSRLTREPKVVASHSNFKDPIQDGDLRGNSRKWADASDHVKLHSLNQILIEAKQKNFNLEQMAFGLSVAYVESGFNPDAAASTTSASGLGQFINKTGAAYGLNESNRFNIRENASAMISELSRLMKYTEKKHKPENLNELFSLTYSHYHDGNILTQKTIDSSREKFPALISAFKEYVSMTCKSGT